MHYRITFRRPQDQQYNVETVHSEAALVRRIMEVTGDGYYVELVENFEPHQDPDNVRFDYETGERIQYADADDASEHHLRMMGG